MAVSEAELERTDDGLVAKSDGWFVVNAREARWLHSEQLGSAVTFEGDVRFSQLGINVNVLQPGQPSCMYHAEDAQEDFLVLSGECVLVIEGQERPLQAWDFVHCPPMTAHVIVGAGSGPCVFIAVGARPKGDVYDGVYPVDEVALKHGAGVEQETREPREAYAKYGRPDRGRYRDGDLPGD